MMPYTSNISFKNILFTLKKYQEGTFELLYVSSEIRNVIGVGDKFYEESFFNSIFPTLPKNLFQHLYKTLGTGDKIICPLILNQKKFAYVEIEGYVISQEDQSYLINALVSPIPRKANTKFSWLVNKNTDAVFTDIHDQKGILDREELSRFILGKFKFLKENILKNFFRKEHSEILPIFPGHLYLSKINQDEGYFLLELVYSTHGSEFHELSAEELPDLIYYEYDGINDELFLSGAIEKITGYPKQYFEGFTGKKWENLVHPEDRHIYTSKYEQVGKFSYRFLHRDDHYIFLEEEITKIEEKTNMLLGVISDITTLKEIEKDLLDKKSVLEELTGVVPGMVYLMKANPDHTHDYIFISEGCKNLTELHPDEIIRDEKNFAEIIHPEDLPQVYKADKEAYLENKKFEAYFRIITPSGKEKWVYGASNRLTQYPNESIWAGFFVDFTYTKQKELESSLHLQKYKVLFDENPMPIFQFDKKGTILEVNQSGLEKIGLKSEKALLGKNLFDMVGNNPIKKAYKESISKGHARYEGPYVSFFNNKLFHLRMTSKTIDGGHTFQVILEDISEQQYVHNVISQLTERTTRLSGQAFFEEITAILVKKLHMSYCFIAEVFPNEEAAQIISFNAKGKKLKPFRYKTKDSPSLDCLQRDEPLVILTEAKAHYPLDEGLQKMDIASYMGVKITDIDQSVLGILVLMDENPKPFNQNISELLKILADRIGAEMGRITYENKLVSSEQLFRSIAENFPKGTVEVLDKNLIYVYADGKEFQEKQINTQELIGTPHLSKYGSYISNEIRKHLDKVLNGESVMFEVVTDQQYYLKSGVPLVNSLGEIDRILLVTQNITETKQAEEEREQLIRDLKSQNEELQRFAYITSHNLRAPIVNISSLVELFDDKNPDNPENKEVIDNLKASTSILNSTLEDLIEVVSIKRNKAPKIELINFKTLLKNVEKSLSKQIRDANLKIHKDFSQARRINYIYSHLENFLINLTTNAIKYRHPDREPEVHISTYTEGNYIVIQFRDNGIGIDLDRYGDRLFGLYQRFHSHVEGKGLGLYLVREQIRAHDGNLKVESAVGQGTVFRIFLKNLVQVNDIVNDIY
jgi:PAS domain S-box-containing protein